MDLVSVHVHRAHFLAREEFDPDLVVHGRNLELLQSLTDQRVNIDHRPVGFPGLGVIEEIERKVSDPIRTSPDGTPRGLQGLPVSVTNGMVHQLPAHLNDGIEVLDVVADAHDGHADGCDALPFELLLVEPKILNGHGGRVGDQQHRFRLRGRVGLLFLDAVRTQGPDRATVYPEWRDEGVSDLSFPCGTPESGLVQIGTERQRLAALDHPLRNAFGPFVRLRAEHLLCQPDRRDDPQLLSVLVHQDQGTRFAVCLRERELEHQLKELRPVPHGVDPLGSHVQAAQGLVQGLQFIDRRAERLLVVNLLESERKVRRDRGQYPFLLKGEGILIAPRDPKNADDFPGREDGHREQ